MIRDNKRDSHWLATFTYGYPQHQLEKQFCNEISNLIDHLLHPGWSLET